MTRSDGRTSDQLRPVSFERHWSEHAEGSTLVSFGKTKVLCTASFTPGRPPLAEGLGNRMGHRRIRDVAAGDHHAQSA